MVPVSIKGTPHMIITKIAVTLSDGSEVFNVRMSEYGAMIELPAVSELDADAFIRVVSEAVRNHTNATVGAPPIKLAHGDRVRLATWTTCPYDDETVRVSTCRGYAVEIDGDPAAFHCRALKKGHATAWTMLAPGVLTNSATENERRSMERKAAFARAITLTAGDAVEIEGERFKVVVPHGNRAFPQNSDPIHFVREA